MKKIQSIFLAICLVVCLITVGTIESNAAEKPKYGGTLTINNSKAPGAFGDPTVFRGGTARSVRLAAEPLIFFSKTDRTKMEPCLAESWVLADDKSHYIFKLRKGVKFHDGSYFNAQAVKWNLDRWITSPSPTLDKLTSVEIIDDYTVKCNLSGWDAVLINDFAWDTLMISPKNYEKLGARGVESNIVGTGPFMQEKYKRNTYIEFGKFDGYWKEGLPYLDKVRQTIIPDVMTASMVFKAKEVDALNDVDTQVANELNEAGSYEVFTNPHIDDAILFNSKDPNSIWANKKARQALEYAIDKEAISKALGRGYWSPSYEIVYGINGTEPGPGTTPRKYDPEKARQLFEEAGLKGAKVDFFFMNTAPKKKIAVTLQGMLQDAGVTLVPNVTQFIVHIQKENTPAMPNELILGHQKPGESLTVAKNTLSAGSQSFQGHKKPEGFTDLLTAALNADDMNKSMEQLYKLERLAYEDAFYIPLFREQNIIAQQPYVKDVVWFWAQSHFPSFEKGWLDK